MSGKVAPGCSISTSYWFNNRPGYNTFGGFLVCSQVFKLEKGNCGFPLVSFLVVDALDKKLVRYTETDLLAYKKQDDPLENSAVYSLC